jgi:hypothetical protein
VPADDPGHPAVIRKESLLDDDAERGGEQIGVAETRRRVERGVRAVEGDAVVLQPVELLRRELEVDRGPGAVMDDEQVAVGELRAGDGMERRVHRAGHPADRLR